MKKILCLMWGGATFLLFFTVWHPADAQEIDDRRWAKILTFDTELGDLDFDEPLFGPLTEISFCRLDYCRTVSLDQGKLTGIKRTARPAESDGVSYRTYHYDGQKLTRQESVQPRGKTIYKFECAGNICNRLKLVDGGRAELDTRYTYFPDQRKLLKELARGGVMVMRYDPAGYSVHKSQGLKEFPDTTQDTLRRDDKEFVIEASMAGLPIQYEYDFDDYGNWIVRRGYVLTNDGRVLAERFVRTLKYK